MEDKQLDFNQPLLSVRRFSSVPTTPEVVYEHSKNTSAADIPSLPAYKSELKSGPIRNPGTVPFLWEKTPGRPKDESRSQCHPSQQHIHAPKHPPGRVVNVKKQDLGQGCEYDKVKQSVPGTVISSCQNVSSLNINVYEGDGLVEENESSDSDSSDEAYLDAVDTLSRSDSFFLNCSLSGLSDLDSTDDKSSGTFFTDVETRDKMIDRFLPAAKAMASESPQYFARKELVASEPPIKVREIFSNLKNYPVKQRNPNAFLHHMQTDVFSEDSESEIDEHERPDFLSTKFCGLFPRSLLKNSFHQANQILGLKKQMKMQISSGFRTQAKSMCTDSPTATGSENYVS